MCVVLETDPGKARKIARAGLSLSIDLPNYRNNWLRYGFAEEDFAAGGSDRLVDSLMAWGDEATIAAKVKEHRDAGADHATVQVLTEDLTDPTKFPLEEWRRLSPALTS